jgi:hypothetical protein
MQVGDDVMGDVFLDGAKSEEQHDTQYLRLLTRSIGDAATCDLQSV